MRASFFVTTRVAYRLNNHLLKGEIVKISNATNTFSCYKDNCQFIRQFTIANNFSFDFYDRYLPIIYLHGTQETYLRTVTIEIVTRYNSLMKLCALETEIKQKKKK